MYCVECKKATDTSNVQFAVSKLKDKTGKSVASALKTIFKEETGKDVGR